MQLFPINRKDQFSASLLFLIAVLSWVTILSGFADQISQPILTKAVFLQGVVRDVIEPKAIISTQDGGYILAGRSVGAWAGKLDCEGNKVWSYEDPLPHEQGAGGLLGFSGVALMPDSSLYLCGNIPKRPPDAPAVIEPSSFVTHLDSMGKLLSKNFITPKNRTPRELLHLDTCIQWGDRVAIIGVINRFSPSSSPISPPFLDHRFYYVVTINTQGNTLWEKEIPVSNISPSFVDKPIIGIDNCLYFSSTDNLTSDIIKIDSEGNLLEQKHFLNQVRLVLPVSNDGILQIFGPKIDGNKSGLITLNQNLEEVGRIIGHPEGDFFSYMAYRLSDGSLFLFGEGIHLLGRRYRAEIAHLNPSLKKQERLDIESERFLNFGRILISSPSSNGIEFLAPVMAASPQNESHASQSGALLNFISVK